MDFKLMDYEIYTFFPPPRPEQAIPPDLIRDCEARGFIAQIKKNGTNNVITVSPGHELTTTTRYGTPHQLWTPSEASGQTFRSLPGKDWYVLNAELLHSKTAQIKDVNFIFDIYVHRSQKLIDHTFAQRQALLFALFVDQIAGRNGIVSFLMPIRGSRKVSGPVYRPSFIPLSRRRMRALFCAILRRNGRHGTVWSNAVTPLNPMLSRCQLLR
jgi:hypothetical protein